MPVNTISYLYSVDLGINIEWNSDSLLSCGSAAGNEIRLIIKDQAMPSPQNSRWAASNRIDIGNSTQWRLLVTLGKYEKALLRNKMIPKDAKTSL